MDYEKKYKEALERASRFELPEYKNVMASVFPELKESDDERISREITEFILTHRIDEPNDIEDTNSWIAWLEKQGEKKEYIFKSLPRLLDMIEPTSKAKAYCQKLIDTLMKEGYATDAKIVGECLKKMNGEKVALATMDEKQGEQKSKWGEEDEIRLDRICKTLWKNRKGDTDEIFQQEQDVDWLKTLKPQNTWKPSDEQIKAIRLARSFVVDDFGEHPTLSEILMELEEQLQKIKENKL